MALERLQFSRSDGGKKVEDQDIRESFFRSAKKRWGEDAPISVISARSGVIKVSVPSPTWRAEIVWESDALKEEINAKLSGTYVRKISVYLG